MKMLPAGGTQLIGRGKDKNVGEMKLRKLRAKNEIENRKGGSKNWNKFEVASGTLNTIEHWLT
jgi:hypothetical protein